MTEIKNLLIENEGLHAENEFLQRQVNALKLRCSELSKRNMELESELVDQRITTALGVPMSKADIEEEQFIAQGEAHYERFAFIGDDF